MDRFSITGAKAGAVNEPMEFSTPMVTAERPTNRMYGNIILVSFTVRSNFSGYCT